MKEYLCQRISVNTEKMETGQLSTPDIVFNRQKIKFAIYSTTSSFSRSDHLVLEHKVMITYDYMRTESTTEKEVEFHERLP